MGAAVKRESIYHQKADSNVIDDPLGPARRVEQLTVLNSPVKHVPLFPSESKVKKVAVIQVVPLP
jgi:hypothetical protein